MSGRILELVSLIHLDWKRHVARQLQPYGVNPKQIFVLRKLRASGGLSPSTVAALLHADRPTVSSLLGTLERAGWVRREPDPDDGRSTRVVLTPEGAAKLASVPERRWRSGRMPDDPESVLTPEERADLKRLLGRLHDTILNLQEP